MNYYCHSSLRVGSCLMFCASVSDVSVIDIRGQGAQMPADARGECVR